MRERLLCLVVAAVIAGTCGASFAARPTRSVRPVRVDPERTKIRHVVFIVQENRSFNNLFMGYPGALTRTYGYDENGSKIALHEQDLVTDWDIGHNVGDFMADYDHGKMDGWNDELACCGIVPTNFAYAYTTPSEIQPYWQMASQYVLADHAFQSNIDGSFVAHQYAIAAYASHAANSPGADWGCPGGQSDTVPTLNSDRSLGPNVVPCFDNPSIGSELDSADLSWRYYTTDVNNFDGNFWNAYQALSDIYQGPDWSRDVITPQTQFLSDVASGQLANVTWVTPTYENSDHPGLDQLTGPAWVASLVNAVGESKFWDSSAVFVIWDDWGGWFDPVKPVYEDYDGLGFRIPIIMISPYAKQGVVAHRQYETTSVVKFIEDTFDLPPLAPSDTRASDPADEAFDFAQAPRPFQSFAAGQPLQYWREQPHPNAGRRPVDGD